MSFSFNIEKKSEIVVVHLKGNLISENQLDDLQNELEFHFNETTPKVVLDLKKMEYMNSTGLNLLIHIFTQARNKGGEIVIINVSEKINKLLLITKLNSIFNVKETLEDAEEVLI